MHQARDKDNYPQKSVSDERGDQFMQQFSAQRIAACNSSGETIAYLNRDTPEVSR
jgi:hypothetical protein